MQTKAEEPADNNNNLLPAEEAKIKKEKASNKKTRIPNRLRYNTDFTQSQDKATTTDHDEKQSNEILLQHLYPDSHLCLYLFYCNHVKKTATEKMCLENFWHYGAMSK